jgi:hypothetical protein
MNILPEAFNASSFFLASFSFFINEIISTFSVLKKCLVLKFISLLPSGKL